MSWFATSANETEAGKEHYYAFLAVDFDFTSGHVRVWSGFGQITINGNVYSGVGEFGSATNSPERSNLTVERKTYRLSGTAVDPALVSETDIDASFGRSVIEHLGFMNNDTHTLLATPEINFEGEISNILRKDGAESVIEVNAEHRLALFDKNDGWRFTHEHQQQFYAGDNGCDQVPKLETKEVLWSGHRVIAGGGGGGGSPGRLPILRR